MVLALVSTATKAFYNSNGSDDKNFLEYGPQASQLLIKVYNGYAAEFTAFEDEQIDIMASPLAPSDYQHLRALDPANLTFTEALYNGVKAKACLSSLRDVVNTVGFGLNGWNTMLNAYDPSGKIVEGFSGDWTSGNPISAASVQDWDVLNEIYDHLISINPYDLGQYGPYIADNWTFGNWTTTSTPWVKAGTYATITFTLRNDVYWQDVPYKDRSAYTWNMSHVDDGPFVGYPLTPLDVAFSIIVQRDLDTFDTAHNGWLVDPWSGLGVDHVAMSPVYQADWPYTTRTPEWFNQTAIDDVYKANYTDGSRLTWQNDSVVFDSTLNPSQITVYLTSPSESAGLEYVGSLPILPYHIWRNLPLDSWSYNGHALLGMGWIDASPSGADILYGTGPYILANHTAGVSFTLVPYTVGQTYEGINSSHSYFWSSPIRAQDPSPDPRWGSNNGGANEAVYWKQGTNSLWYTPGVIEDKDPSANVYTFTVEGWYDYMYYNGAWHNNTAGTTAFAPITGIVLTSCGTVYPWLNSGPLVFPAGTTYIDVWVSYSINITAINGVPLTNPIVSQGGDFGYGGKKMLGYNSYKASSYTGRLTEMFNVAHTNAKADIAGANASLSGEPYWGSNYMVNTADLTLLAAKWNKMVPWTNTLTGNPWTQYLVNPTDRLHRADFVGAGKIDLADLHTLSQEWGTRGSWTDNPPADPGYFLS